VVLMLGDNVSNNPTIAHPRCGVSQTLKGGYCELAGEVEFGGVLLCGRHARRLQAQDRRDLLRGIVSSLDLSLRSIPLRRDKNLALLLRAQRAQATRELALAYEDLQRVEEDTS
jgi:hypothetical protein